MTGVQTCALPIYFNIADTTGDAKSYFNNKTVIVFGAKQNAADNELVRIGVVGNISGKGGELVKALAKDDNSELVFHFNPYALIKDFINTDGLTPVKVYLNGVEAWYFQEYFDLYDPAEKENADVIGVIDGDTIKVDRASTDKGMVESTRLIGLNTPETVDPNRPPEFFGPEASNFAKSALKGEKVKLSYDWNRYDNFGRLLSYVWVPVQHEGQTKYVLFNLLAILNGYGTAYTSHAFDEDYMEMFCDVQMFAEDNNLGMWATDNSGADYNFMVKIRGKVDKYTLSKYGSAAKLFSDCAGNLGGFLGAMS